MATEPEGFAYALQDLTGEVHALGLLPGAAVARSHPDRAALLVQMDLAEQQGLAHNRSSRHWATQPFTDTGSCSIT